MPKKTATKTSKKAKKAAVAKRRATSKKTRVKVAKSGKRAASKKAAKPPKPRTAAARSTKKKSSKSTGAATKSARSNRAAKKPSSRLTAKDLADFREVLLSKRSELVGDVNNLQNQALHTSRQEAAGDLSSMPIHMADLGSDNFEHEFTLGLIEGERAVLQEIDEALARIADGSYGLCAATGKPIGKARLRAKPWAKYCYEYTLAQEKGQERRF